MHVLPNEVLEHIFSFCGTYRFVVIQVCKRWREFRSADLDRLDFLNGCSKKELDLLVKDKAKVFVLACERKLENLSRYCLSRDGAMEAAKTGKVKALRYYKQHLPLEEILWDVTEEAITAEQIEVLKFTSGEEGVSISDIMQDNELLLSSLFVENKERVLTWLLDKNELGYVLPQAVKSGNVKLLKLVLEKSPENELDSGCYEEAIKVENLSMLRFLYKNNCPKRDDYRGNKRLCHIAVKVANLKVIDWLLKKNIVKAKDLLDKSINKNKLDVLLHILKERKNLWTCMAKEDVKLWFPDAIEDLEEQGFFLDLCPSCREIMADFSDSDDCDCNL